MQINCHSNRFRISRDGKSCCEFHHKQYAELIYDLENLKPMEFLIKHDMPMEFAIKMNKACIESIKNSDQGFHILHESIDLSKI